MRPTHSPVRLLRDSLLVHTMMGLEEIGQETAFEDQAEVPEGSLVVRCNETVDLVGIA